MVTLTLVMESVRADKGIASRKKKHESCVSDETVLYSLNLQMCAKENWDVFKMLSPTLFHV